MIFLYLSIALMNIMQHYLGECSELLGSVLKDGSSAEEMDFEDVEKACACFLVIHTQSLMFV